MNLLADVRALIVAGVILVAPAVAGAQAPARLIDGDAARVQGMVAAPLAVAVSENLAGGDAVARFLYVAGDRGARFAGRLAVRTTRGRRGARLSCIAPLAVRYSPYPPDGPRWRIEVGSERCVPSTVPRPPREVVGEMYLPPFRPASPAEMRATAPLLEPLEPIQLRRHRHRHRPRRHSRAELDALVRQLE